MRRGRDGNGDLYDRRARGELLRLDESQRLPWLEPEEDEEDERGLAWGGGVGARPAFTLLLGMLAVLAALGAGVWWLLERHQSDAIVADGSIIEAPPGPYKVRPADAGGTEVAGTGDVSFAVSEGEERVGHIAGEGAGAASASELGGGEAVGAIGVQIGAYASEAEANAAWVQLSGRIEALQGHGHRVLEGSADAGSVFRLQAIAGSETEAATLCDAIRGEGGDCQVKG